MSHFLFFSTHAEKPSRLTSTSTWLVVLVLAALLFLLPTHSVSANAPEPGDPIPAEGFSPVGDAPQDATSVCPNQAWSEASVIQVTMVSADGTKSESVHTPYSIFTFLDGTVQYGYCVDILHSAAGPYCVNSDKFSDWKVAWFIANYPPGPSIDRVELAARQAVVWHLTNQYSLVAVVDETPATAELVMARYAVLIDIIPDFEPPSVDSTFDISLTPAEINFIPGGNEHQMEATLTADGNPLPGQEVTINVVDSVHSGSPTQVEFPTGFVTDINGKINFKITNTSNSAYTATINASATVNSFAGVQLFNQYTPSTVQVLGYGYMQPIPVTGQTTKEWQYQLSALKFNDLNYNGVRDIAEPVISGWEFTLYKANGVGWTLIETRITATDGKAIWSGLLDGTYKIVETPQTGWTNTTPLEQIIQLPLGPCSNDGIDCPTYNVTFGNIQVGRLDVTKKIVWNGPQPVMDLLFRICVSGPNPPQPASYAPSAGSITSCKDLTGEGIVSWENLLPGSYTVTETIPGENSRWVVIGSGENVNVVSNQTATATITNSYQQGSLTISKLLSNPNGASVPQTFIINYNCGEGYTGSVSIPAGGSATVNNLPIGNTCTVTEAALTPITGYTWADPVITPAEVTIGAADTDFTIEVTNSITRDPGRLKIMKVFNPLSSGFTGTFSIHYDCNDGTVHDGTAVLAAGASTIVTGIPIGTQCTVSEPSMPTAPAGWIFGTPTISPNQPVTITSSITAIEVTVTNTISQIPGSLTVTKTVNWNTVDPVQNQTFEICVQGPSFQTPNCKTIGYQGGDLTWSDLIPGQYIVTETNPGENWVVTITGSPATVPAGGAGSAEVLNETKTPTAVTLAFFGVKSVTGNQVTLTWTTATETDNFLFNVYRSHTSNFGDAVNVGDVMAKPYGTEGATYEFANTTPYQGVWYYWLEDVDTTGMQTLDSAFSPLKVVVSDIRVYLPSITKIEVVR